MTKVTRVICTHENKPYFGFNDHGLTQPESIEDESRFRELAEREIDKLSQVYKVEEKIILKYLLKIKIFFKENSKDLKENPQITIRLKASDEILRRRNQNLTELIQNSLSKYERALKIYDEHNCTNIRETKMQEFRAECKFLDCAKLDAILAKLDQLGIADLPLPLGVKKNSDTSNSTGTTLEAMSAVPTTISNLSTSTTLKFYRAHDSKVPSSGRVSLVVNKQVLPNTDANSDSGKKKTSKKDKSNLMNKLIKAIRMKIKKK